MLIEFVTIGSLFQYYVGPVGYPSQAPARAPLRHPEEKRSPPLPRSHNATVLNKGAPAFVLVHPDGPVLRHPSKESIQPRLLRILE